MTDQTDTITRVREHCNSTGLTDRIKSALATITPENPGLGIAHLAPLDQFPTRGILATSELAAAVGLDPRQIQGIADLEHNAI
jgi:hypothetical protein